MKLTYQQSKEIACGVVADVEYVSTMSAYLSGESWNTSDYVFEITAGDGKIRVEISEDLIREGFPN